MAGLGYTPLLLLLIFAFNIEPITSMKIEKRNTDGPDHLNSLFTGLGEMMQMFGSVGSEAAGMEAEGSESGGQQGLKDLFTGIAGLFGPETTGSKTAESETVGSEPAADGKQCDVSWISGPNGACYYFPELAREHQGTFDYAKSFCSKIGDSTVGFPAHLVSIETEKVQKFIEQMLVGYPEIDVWTNGNRLNPLDDKVWHWGDEAESIESHGYVNWDEGQPQWVNFIDEEKCIFLGHKSRFNFKWHDHRCSYDLATPLCEYKMSAPPPTEDEAQPDHKDEYEDDDESYTQDVGSGSGQGYYWNGEEWLRQ